MQPPAHPLFVALALCAGAAPALAGEAEKGPRPDTTPTLKWAAPIGKTTYRSTIHVQRDRIIVNSNGADYKSKQDEWDGVYLLNAKDGQLIRRIVPPGKGEKDCNGVALDGDHLIFGTDQGSIYKVTDTGKVLWRAFLKGDIEAAPVLAELNGDGILDVAIGAEEGHFYGLNGKNGKKLFTLRTAKGDYGQRGFVATAAARDFNGDGRAELFVPGRDGVMRALDGKSGKPLWQKGGESGRHGAPVIVDTNGDGRYEVIFTASYSMVTVADAQTGRVLWETELKNPRGGIEGLFAPVGWLPAEQCALIASAWWKRAEGVSCVGPRGVRWRYTEQKENITSGVVIADVDGSPGDEIVFGTESGKVVAIDTDGGIVWTYDTGGPVECAPTIADIDADGLNEVLVAVNDNIFYIASVTKEDLEEVQNERIGLLHVLDTQGKGPPLLGYYRGSPRNDGFLFAAERQAQRR